MTIDRNRHPLEAGQRLLASTITALLFTAGAQAGTATIESADGGSIDLEYRGDMLRINTDEANTYIVVREGTMYMVNIEDGQPMVFNASSMMKGMAGAATQFAQNDAVSNFQSLEKTGRKETLAGIEGDVYLLTFTDDRGQQRQEEAVLSKSKEARELRDAFFAMTAIAGELTDEKSQESSAELMGRLDSLDAGVLRVGEDMRVTALSNEAINVARFELPAEPMDMSGLGSMLSGAMSRPAGEDGSSASGESGGGGLLGGMLGGFGKQQTEESDEESEEEAPEEGGKNPLKSLGKLFGRRD